MNINNLKNLLNEYNVVIPMLQRDYVQGKKSKISIAESFLRNIFEVLEGNQNKLHIDFIYGYLEDNNFILIDGQQRVTTLWLLYLIIYKINNDFDNIKELLSNFSYRIRESSYKFCKNLINKELKLDVNPKEYILNSTGTFGKTDELNNDPTIKAMLNMMDLIYKKIEDKDTQTLNKYKNNLDNITFSIFNMGEYDLGEELYIKMNARGKQLSKYENLKAYIESDLNLKEHYDLLASIDNLWSDYFFDIKNKDKFDNRALSFLYYSALFFHIDSNISNKDLINYLDSNIEIIDHSFFSILKLYKNIKLLNNAIEVLYKYKDILNIKIFDDIKLLRKDICYFYAFLFFIKKLNNDNFDKKIFNDYYRVCRHFIENHRLDKPEHIKSFYDLFADLSNGYSDIYKYLSCKSKLSSFHTEIYELEIKKAKLILESRYGGDNWEDILNKTSDNNFLVGWVGFLLDFSKKNNKEDFDKFTKYTNLTIEIIDRIIKQDGFLNLFQRALLIFGDYGFYSRNYYYYYGNIPQVSVYRDREAWNWLLSGYKNDFGNKNYLKQLFDKIILHRENDIEKALISIINNANLKNKLWFEYLLIKDKKLFEYIDKEETFQKCGRIRKHFDNNDHIIDCLLLPPAKGKRESIDLLSYSFYLYIKDKVEVSEFKADKVKYDKYEDNRNKNSYFDIIIKSKNKEIICDSINSIIKIGTKKYNINLGIGSDIFVEFNRILKEAKLIK
ncbi:DUF262 domain-containing protein [Brachyspira murdochii]|uniref:GmrSD restriction endonucleases N-terminal domain-containing protein n=1 Tax=Brachyspira murdochii (strain ATCC 51284 / DSM 12563 / 56-150) TaxID=526224 RepID=D5U9R9_BRAM5|nr:DUF262 domain-containing protein [Brachyspira murdochii]ADG71442.1 protein of unknown function DUF262 [Brachyspira murdochii DSM 12563]